MILLLEKVINAPLVKKICTKDIVDIFLLCRIEVEVHKGTYTLSELRLRL